MCDGAAAPQDPGPSVAATAVTEAVAGTVVLPTETTAPLARDGWRRRDAPSALDRLVREDLPTLGLLTPVENDWARGIDGPAPAMKDHDRHVALADSLGFSAVWLRDIPTFDPAFGDAGHVWDPWTYAGYLAAVTRRIAIGTAAIVAPLDHPIHVLKRAASIDQISGGRFLLGLAAGDRPSEFPAFGVAPESRGERLRACVELMERVWPTEPDLARRDVLPRPRQTGGVPLVIVGRAQQELDWIAAHADAWFVPPRPLGALESLAADWRIAGETAGGPTKPLLQPVRLVLDADPGAPLREVRGVTTGGLRAFRDHLRRLHDGGIDHVALNLRLSRRPIPDVLSELAGLAAG